MLQLVDCAPGKQCIVVTRDCSGGECVTVKPPEARCVGKWHTNTLHASDHRFIIHVEKGLTAAKTSVLDVSDQCPIKEQTFEQCAGNPGCDPFCGTRVFIKNPCPPDENPCLYPRCVCPPDRPIESDGRCISRDQCPTTGNSLLIPANIRR